MKTIILIMALSILASCASVNSVSQTSIPKNKSNIVKAKVEKNIIFLMNFNNDYIDNLTQQLMNQCPNGSVKGILTKDENFVYFPIIFHKSVISAEGYCIDNIQAKSNIKQIRKRQVRR